MPIQNLKEAREAYEFCRSRGKPKTLPPYNRMKAEFELDSNSFTKLGIRYQRTRETMRKIHKRFFSAHIPRQPDGMTRRRVWAIKRKVLKKIEKAITREKLFFSKPAAAALKSFVKSHGLEIKVLDIRHGHILSIGVEQCALYVSNNARRAYRGAKKLYWSFRLRLSALKKTEFVVFVVRDKKFRYFIVPKCVLPRRFFRTNGNLYIPKGGINPKRRRQGYFDIFPFENRLDLLSSSAKEKTAPVVLVAPVYPSPVS